MDSLIAVEIIFVFVLLVLSAFFSGSETALTSVSRIKIRHLAKIGKKNARILRSIIENPTKMLSSLLVGNNLVNIALSVIATKVCIELFPSYGETIAFFSLSILILIFGEITPKTFAAYHAESISLRIAPVIHIIMKIIYPIVNFLTPLTTKIVTITGGKHVHSKPFVTEEEIKMLVDAGEKDGVLQESEKEMINSIFEFGDAKTKDVMVPRTDMVAISVDTPFEKVVKTCVTTGFSRIPVYQGNRDNIVGIVYAKDVLEVLASKKSRQSVKDIMRKPLYVPESKKLDDLLRELKKKKQHMAIVIDEYGGTAGIVTIEDLLEEIVGEIQDEYDKEELSIKKINDNTYILTGVLNISEINDEIDNINIPEDDIETVAGFIYSLLGKIPEEGETAHYKNLEFVIMKMKKNKIDKIKLIIHPKKTQTGSKDDAS